MATPPFPWEAPGQQYDPNLPDWMQQTPDAVAYATPASPVVPVAPWEPEPQLDPSLVNAPNANAIDNAIASVDQAPAQDPDLALLDMAQGPGSSSLSLSGPTAPPPMQELDLAPTTYGVNKYGVPVAPDLNQRQAEYDAVASQQADLARQRAAIEAQQAEQEAQAEEQRALELNRLRTEENIAIARENKLRADAEKKVVDAESAIPSQRGFFDGAPGKQVTAVIGGFLSGLLAPYNNGRNLFLEQLNTSIDQHFRQEQERVRAGEAKVARAEQGLVRLDTALARDAKMRELTRSRILEELEARIKAEASQFKSPFVQQRANEAIVAINRQRLDLRAKLVDDQFAQDLQTLTTTEQVKTARQQRALAAEAARRAREAALAGPAPRTEEEELKLQKLRQDVAAGESERNVVDPVTGKLVGRVEDPKQAAVIKDNLQSFHDVNVNLKRMSQLINEVGGASGFALLRSDEQNKRAAEFNSLRQDTAAKLAKLSDPGSTIRESELEIQLKRLPDLISPLGGREASNLGKTKALIQGSKDALKRKLKSASLDVNVDQYGYGDEYKQPKNLTEAATKAASAYMAPTDNSPINQALAGSPVGKDRALSPMFDSPVADQVIIQSLVSEARRNPDAFSRLQAIAMDPNHRLRDEAIAAIDGILSNAR